MYGKENNGVDFGGDVGSGLVEWGGEGGDFEDKEEKKGTKEGRKKGERELLSDVY